MLFHWRVMATGPLAVSRLAAAARWGRSRCTCRRRGHL